MAENLRTQIKAAIKRASAKARESGNKLDREALDELTRLYREAAYQMTDTIESYADQDGSLKLVNMQDLLNQVEQQLDTLSATRDALLNSKMTETALLATSAFSSDVARMGVSLNQLANDAVLQARAFIAEDGLQLSDRIWRIDNNAKRSVGDAIQSAIIQGQSAANAAQEFISSGKPIPPDINSKIDSAIASRVGRDASTALIRKDGNAYRHSLRLFRTEINRAHNDAYEMAAAEHPDAVGTRFLLSPMHPEVDICDMHANANLYGLGPGVYPFGKNPLPAHPNTLSYKEVVFADEVTVQDQDNKTDRIAWLKEQTVSRQNQILGRGKGWMLREGYLTQGAIGTPWSVLKAKLEKQGIELPTFRIEGPLVETPRPSDRIAPVSDAFDVLEFKQISQHVLDKIDSVHSDGALPVIPLTRTTTKESGSAYGLYSRTHPDRGDQAVKIALNRKSPHPEFTLAHEIGHFIDHKGLPGSYMSSEYHPVMEKWRKAVMDSPEIQWLQQLSNGSSQVVIEGNVHRIPKDYISYLLRRREIWARSYSQWISMKSGDKKLVDQLKAEINQDAKRQLPLPGQWREENFGPIAEAIEELFKQMGWL